ncbi:MAG: hypothetical protein RL885_28460, partial [Planctomycetota bacterium]
MERDLDVDLEVGEARNGLARLEPDADLDHARVDIGEGIDVQDVVLEDEEADADDLSRDRLGEGRIGDERL